MIKRVISGLLSAVMGTVLITTDFNTAKQLSNAKISNEEKTFVNDNMSINATNSLGNYISDAMQQKEQPQKMSYQCVSDYNYDVGFAEFDIETKRLLVYSSQPSDAKVSVIFKNEDTGEAAFTAEYEAKQGKDTINTYDVENAEFPEFFTIDIMLFNSFNTPVCEPYTITTYTRFVQEMKATDIYDYEEEYVVNLDEDETTNFIVLNENTIKAETTDDTNILVSADYEKDQYVFEHIDETIRYLDKGDHFFIQPTEEDIIALSVGDISIDGDRAVLTGDGNIDGMFDVIKIDTDINDVSDASVIEDDMPENMNYNGIVEDENGLSALDFTFGESYSYDADDPNNIPINWNFKFGVGTKELRNDDEDDALQSLTVNKLKEIPEATVMKLKEDKANNKLGKFEKGLELSGDVKIEANLKYHFYWKWFHVEFELAMDPTITVEIEAKGEGQFPFGTPPVVVMVFPGLWFGFKPELSFKFEGDLKYKNTFSVDCILSFDTSREKMFSSSCEPVANPIDKDADNELLIEANVAISLDLCPIIYFIDENVISLAISMPAELGLEISTNDLSLDIAERTSLPPHTVYLGDMYYDKDTIHTCDYCFELRPYLKWEGNLVCNILCIPFLNEVSINLFEFEVHTKDEDDDGDDSNHWFDKLYFSFTNREIDFGECPHQAYKTTFHISDLLYDSDQEAEVSVDRIKVKVDNHGFAEFYCENGTHDYTVLVDGEEIKSDSFKIEDAVKEFIISPFEDGQVIEGEKKETHEHTKSVSIADFVQDVPELSAEAKHIETGKLGENISYYIYPNGDMKIYGSGEMYDQLPTIVNKSKVKTVYFVDSSPEKNKYITSIGNGLFKDVKNLEIVYLSNEITKIGNNAFDGCTNLKYFRYGGENDTTETLVLPEKLESIGNSAFRNCSSAQISDLIIPDSVTYVGDFAFSNCFNINKITIGSLDLICKHPLYSILNSDKCNDTYDSQLGIYLPYSLKTIVVKDGDTIPNRAFYMMSGIEEIDLPEGITSISNEAFYGCSKANFDCKKLFENVETIGASAFYNCKKAEFGDLTFSDSTKTIGSNAFYGCKGIKSLVIPETVDTVMAGAFGSCSGIKSIIIESENTNFKGLGNWGIKQIFVGCDSLETIQYPIISTSDSDKKYIIGALFQESENGNVIIPASLKTIIITQGTEIDNNTFWGLQEKNITKVVLPDTIEKIGSDSLRNFTGLEEIVIPQNVTEIGLRAFQKCNSLKKVYLHDNIKHISEAAFEECTGIEEVNYEGSDEQWNDIIIEDRNDPIKRGNVKVNFNVPAPTEDAPVEWVSGDANGDGEIDMSDIVLIMQALANPDRYGVNGTDPTHITENGFKYGDVNGDGLTVKDAQHIQLYLLGKISSLV